MSAWTYRLTARPPDRLFHLVLESHDGRAPGADSEEKHEPVSDIDTGVVDSLKALDPEWPIREADIVSIVALMRPGEIQLDLFRRLPILRYRADALGQAAASARA